MTQRTWSAWTLVALATALAACSTRDDEPPAPTEQKKGWVYDDGPVFPPIKR